MSGLMDYERASALLRRYGIRTARAAYVRNAKEAASFSKGKAIALKAISGKALHKSKAGLIALDLKTPEEISSAYSVLSEKAARYRPYKILAQEMSPKGLEVIIGGRIDPQFGKLILIGLGGIYVETFKDFALRVCPITKYDAGSMLHQLRSGKVIAPTGEAESMIIDLLVSVSRMLQEHRISELDLNPIIVRPDGYEAVDLRILK